MHDHILGICCYGTNDTGVALLDPAGKLLYMSEEERFSRIKKDTSFPAAAIDDALRYTGISIDAVSDVGFYSDLSGVRLSAAFHTLRNLPLSLLFLGGGVDSYRRHQGFARVLREKTAFSGKVHQFPHHLCHAASAYYLSPFDSAAVLTLDGTGEFTTGTTWLGDGIDLHPFSRGHFPHSIGRVYEAFTQYLGFKPNRDEGKVMGLAGHGDPAPFRCALADLIHLEPDGRYRVNLRYFLYHLGSNILFSHHLEERFGPRRMPESTLDERYRDIAAAVQERLEDVGLHLSRSLAARTQIRNLCLAGGVTLNTQMNARIETDGVFERVFVPPPAGDPGTALGAAKLVHHRTHAGQARERMTHAYWGPGYDDQECERAAQTAGANWRRVEDPGDAAAEAIARGKIVSWFQGRMEIGPRALGNRSILGDPRRPEMADVMNRRVKKRESFRPFAPAVLAERCSDYFDRPGPQPFMLSVFGVRQGRRSEVPSITHVDGSARVQTVHRESNPSFYHLIERFEHRTGVPVVLNTSFNVRGEPIVCTPADAIACFQNTDIDRLYLGKTEIIAS